MDYYYFFLFQIVPTDLRLTWRGQKGSANDLIEATRGTVKVRAFNRLCNRPDPSRREHAQLQRRRMWFFQMKGRKEKTFVLCCWPASVSESNYFWAALHISEGYAFSEARPRWVNNGGLASVPRPEKSLIYLCDIKHNRQPPARDFNRGRVQFSSLWPAACLTVFGLFCSAAVTELRVHFLLFF